jgi:hypothetical protein
MAAMKLPTRRRKQFVIATFGSAFAMGNAVKYLNEVEKVKCSVVDHWTLRVNLLTSKKGTLEKVRKAIKRAEGYEETDPERIVRKGDAKEFSPLDYPVFG